jgi:hypothetical protein
MKRSSTLTAPLVEAGEGGDGDGGEALMEMEKVLGRWLDGKLRMEGSRLGRN